MRSLLAAALLIALGAGLSACVYAPPPGPHYGAHWVPGHYNPYGQWVPGHWA